MSDNGVIIKEVCGALDTMLKKTSCPGADDLESRDWWTNQVLTTLCTWGLAKGFWVGAKGMKDNERLATAVERQHGGKIGGERLYDFTCIEYEKRWVKRVPLVAECEWTIHEKNHDEVNDDFEKLLLARADVRLMISNGNPYRDKGQKSIPPNGLKVFRTYVDKFEHTCTGDTYLFAARLHDSENGKSVEHRFDYHLVVS